METIFLVTSTSKGSSPSPICAFQTLGLACAFLNSMQLQSSDDEKTPKRINRTTLRVYPFGYAVTYRVEPLTLVK